MSVMFGKSAGTMDGSRVYVESKEGLVNDLFRGVASGVMVVALLSTLTAVMPQKTLAETPIATPCTEFTLPQVDRDQIALLYDGRTATGYEAIPIVELLQEYGDAIGSGDVDRLAAVVTPEFNSTMGISACPERFSESGQSDAPVMLLTPLRVTTDDGGSWLAFVQRAYDDGSESGYQDVFMIVAVEQDDGSILIDFAHRDIQFTDGMFRDAESIYLEGIGR